MERNKFYIANLEKGIAMFCNIIFKASELF